VNDNSSYSAGSPCARPVSRLSGDHVLRRGPRVAGIVAGYTRVVRILGRLITTMTRLAAFGAGYVLGARAARRRAEKPAGVHPLLADQHVDTQDELVYSTGPDIEETVDELMRIGDADRL